MARGDLDVAQVHAGVEHGGEERVPEHVRVHPGKVDPGLVGQVVQATGRGVPVHPPALPVPQDRPLLTAVDGAFDRTLHGWRQGCQDDLAALATDLEDPVAVLLTQVLDVRAAHLARYTGQTAHANLSAAEDDLREAVQAARDAGDSWTIIGAYMASGT